MKASTVARRDAILCAVRDGALVTTHEVCRAICATCKTNGPSSYHCYPTVYQDLRALDRQGLVHWEPSNGVTAATWMLTMKAREQFVTADLEALWVASP